MKYDDASWHSGCNFPVKKVVSGQASATNFLFEHCDGKLFDDMLSAAGRAFAEQYYGDDGLYLDDYTEHFGGLM